MKGTWRRWLPVLALTTGCASSTAPLPPPAAVPIAERAHVPSPREVLGFTPGDDRRLADWSQITDYLQRVARTSDRVRMDTLGPTTLGRPFVMLTIASPSTLAHLEEYQGIQQRLADPRRIAGAAAADSLIQRGKTVVLITCAIHSTEVGASQVPLNIAYRLASSDDPSVREVLDNTIVLLVPSLNPDGNDLVAHWYASTLGTPWEGAAPPFLYHYYTGHDNNRDWYFFSQKETQLTIARAHNAWHPQIVHDIHQQGSRGSRFFIPPYIDPVEPNVDPLLVEGVNQLGSYMAWRMGQQGFRGITINSTYDAWTPARAYQHYHGGVRILTETASAALASPVTIAFDSLQPGRNYDPRTRSWNFPELWPGGEWHLRDIVAYQEAGAFALLENAARNRAAWLRTFYEVGRRAVTDTVGWKRENGWPRTWVIVDDAARALPIAELTRVLVEGGVEVRKLDAPASVRPQGGADPIALPAGSYAIDMRQPYAAFAQTLLERQRYPDLRQYPGGPPRPPYDVTAHSLPLLLGVRAVASDSVLSGVASHVVESVTPVRIEPGLTAGTGTPPRIAVYQSHAPAIDEGWTRWLLDAYRIPFDTLHDADVRNGKLSDGVDVLVLPSQSPRALRSGRTPGSIAPQYTGGLGKEGAEALRRFVHEGGTLVALERSSEYAIDALELPVDVVNDGFETRDFYIPGSILATEVDTASALAHGMPPRGIAWFGAESLAFTSEAMDVRIPVRYARTCTLLSGWALGEERIAGAGAVAVVPYGNGRVVLFGFAPQYRAQSLATFPLFFNALRHSRGHAQ